MRFVLGALLAVFRRGVIVQPFPDNVEQRFGLPHLCAAYTTQWSGTIVTFKETATRLRIVISPKPEKSSHGREFLFASIRYRLPVVYFVVKSRFVTNAPQFFIFTCAPEYPRKLKRV
jgi:hypothetical protein